MVDDALKLTLDVVFPPLKGDALPEHEPEDSKSKFENCSFTVLGYPDELNMWGECFYKFR